MNTLVSPGAITMRVTIASCSDTTWEYFSSLTLRIITSPSSKPTSTCLPSWVNASAPLACFEYGHLGDGVSPAVRLRQTRFAVLPSDHTSTKYSWMHSEFLPSSQ